MARLKKKREEDDHMEGASTRVTVVCVSLIFLTACATSQPKASKVGAKNGSKSETPQITEGSQVPNSVQGRAGQLAASTTLQGPSVGPSPWKPDWEPDTTIDASLTTKCVVPGTAMGLSVRHMKKDSSVGFQAIYSDNKSGAPKPFGAGYGGNDGSMIDETGQHTWVWTVRSDTPLGPGRVDVIAAIIGVGRAYSALPFEVQRTC